RILKTSCNSLRNDLRNDTGTLLGLCLEQIQRRSIVRGGTQMNARATQDLSEVPVLEVPSSGIRSAHSGSRAARAHRVMARVLLAGIAVQYFFAGLGVFGITSFLPHVIFGTLVVVASFALPIIAWRGHLHTTIQRRSWLLGGLMILQGGLIDLGRVLPI